MKSAGSSSDLSINGTQVTSLATPGNYTMYPSGYVVVGQHDFTKHYYTGSQRIATRMGDLATVNNFQNASNQVGFSDFEDGSTLESKKALLQNQLITIFAKAKLKMPNFETLVAPAPIDPAETACEEEYTNLMAYWANLGTEEAAFCIRTLTYLYSMSGSYCSAIATLKIKTDCYIDLSAEPIWWYHADHLGSSSYLTDYSGLPSHYYNYLPFGEEMVSQNTSSYTNKYRFSGKELDEETGLSYFGARYYNPKWSVWLGVDPLMEKYPGVSPYVYCMNNPILYIDPDGRDVIVGASYQANFNKALSSVFGDLQKGFSYDDKGKLSFSGDVSKFSKDQKEVYNGLNGLMSSKDVTNIVYEKEYNITDNEKQSITIDASKSGGESTLLKAENSNISQNYIIIDPNSKTSIDVLEVTDNYYETKGTMPVSFGKPNFKPAKVPINPENSTWHGIGHVIYAGKSQEKVLDFDNKTRALSTPSLTPRKPDETHNKTVTKGDGTIWKTD